ncbi:MAG: hypothetical protein KDK34_00985 [Leptospiraceae bacterium]|nr:hypothetical protein [Leptospiraceae bacterium]
MQFQTDGYRTIQIGRIPYIQVVAYQPGHLVGAFDPGDVDIRIINPILIDIHIQYLNSLAPAGERELFESPGNSPAFATVSDSAKPTNIP